MSGWPAAAVADGMKFLQPGGAEVSWSRPWFLDRLLILGPPSEKFAVQYTLAHLRRLEPIIQAEAGAPATSRRWYRLLSTQAPGRSPKKKQNGEVGLWKQVSR